VPPLIAFAVSGCRRRTTPMVHRPLSLIRPAACIRSPGRPPPRGLVCSLTLPNVS
jgi:hypothetical protein